MTSQKERSTEPQDGRLPAALSARSLLGHVVLMSDAIVVKERSGQRSWVGQWAELGYNRNASSGRVSEKDCSFSVRRSVRQPERRFRMNRLDEDKSENN